MAESQADQRIMASQQQWNIFVSLINQDLNELYTEKRRITSEIKRIEKTKKLLQDNIDFFIDHKDSIIALDNSLEKKFNILEVFQKRNNLNNPVAIRTYNEIINSESIKEEISKLDSLIEEKNNVESEIEKLNDTIRGVSFDLDIIQKYCKKHNIDERNQYIISLYPALKSVQKAPKIIEEKEQKVSKDSKIFDNVDDLGNTVEESSNKSKLETLKEKYEKAKEPFSDILNKYYVILKNMTPTESKYYKNYSQMSSSIQHKEENHDYNEAMAKTIAFNLFSLKTKIEGCFNAAENKENLADDEIKQLENDIEDFITTVNKLQELDKKIVEDNKKMIEIKSSNVFFFRNPQPIILDNDLVKEQQDSLISIISYLQDGIKEQNNEIEINKLKSSKKFNNTIGRDIYSIRNSNVIVSYIRLNSKNELDGAKTMIITASSLKPNTIQDDTYKVIAGNIDQIQRQISSIERGDPQELGLQEMILEEITSTKMANGGELNGRKAE